MPDSPAEIAAARPRRRPDRRRHRVHGRRPLPVAAVPGADRRRAGRRPLAGRAANRRARPADRRARTRARSPTCSPTRTSRSSCTPAARTSPCCAGPGPPTCATSSTPRWPPASPGLRRAARLRGAAPRDARRPPAQDRELHPLGHPAAQPRAGRVRARGRAAHPPGRRRAQGPPAGAGPPRLGAARSAAALEDVTDVRDPAAIFERLPRVDGLDPNQRAVARELVEWREETSRASPTGRSSSILNDAALVELAKRRPATTSSGCRTSAGINEGTLRRRGRTILAAIERGRERDADPAPWASAARRPTPRTAR